MSTRTPMPSLSPASTTIAVFPHPVPVFMIPLPDDYPRLPLGEVSFQPVAYNQGTGNASGNVNYVTVLVPLLAKQGLIPATEISMDGGTTGYTFTYSIQLVTDPAADDFDRLALMSFSFLTPAEAGIDFKVAIEVLPLGNTGSQGKVVMDSNMDPTLLNN